jgi:hypothetical protein
MTLLRHRQASCKLTLKQAGRNRGSALGERGSWAKYCRIRSWNRQHDCVGYPAQSFGANRMNENELAYWKCVNHRGEYHLQHSSNSDEPATQAITLQRGGLQPQLVGVELNHRQPTHRQLARYHCDIEHAITKRRNLQHREGAAARRPCAPLDRASGMSAASEHSRVPGFTTSPPCAPLSSNAW